MALWQGQSTRKSTGGRLLRARGKRRYEVSRERIRPVIAPTKTKLVRVKGNNQKVRMLTGDQITVNQNDGSAKVVAVKRVLENPTNLNYVRRNILTKGAVVETELGSVRITSRPGQTGTLCGQIVA